MDNYLRALTAVLPLTNNNQDPRENSNSHAKRYQLLEPLLANNIDLPRWLLLNRYLEPSANDPLLVRYHPEAEFILPPTIRPIAREINALVTEFKKLKAATYSEPTFKTKGRSYVLSRRLGREITIGATQYDHLKSSLVGGPTNYYGLMYDMLLRYELFPYEFGYLESYYELLRDEYRVEVQLLTTPVQHLSKEYGSLFYDVDHPFGSLGCLIYENDPIVERIKKGGNFELSLLFLDSLYAPFLIVLEQIIGSTKAPLTIFVLVHGKVEQRERAPFTSYYFERSNLTLIVYNTRKGKLNLESLLAYFGRVGEPVEQRSVELVPGFTVKIPQRGTVSLPYLTVYEKAMAVGNRAHQFVRGGVLQVEPKVIGKRKDQPEVDELEYDLLNLADQELNEKKMPITVRRTLPNGDNEDFQINTLIDIN